MNMVSGGEEKGTDPESCFVPLCKGKGGKNQFLEYFQKLRMGEY